MHNAASDKLIKKKKIYIFTSLLYLPKTIQVGVSNQGEPKNIVKN